MTDAFQTANESGTDNETESGTESPKTAAPADEDRLSEVPQGVQEAARIAPDHWFGMVDPAWRGEGPPPEWAVVGRYRSSTEGEVVEWQHNDDYRPSPSANGWPEPTDPVDEAIQLAATGYGPEDDVFRLLAEAEVGVLLTPGGGPVTATAPDGEAVVPVFTSQAQLEEGGRYAARTVTVPDLLEDLDEGLRLYVNPAGAVSMSVLPEQLSAEDERQPDAETRDLPEPDPEPDPEPGSLPKAQDEKSAPASARDHLVDILSGKET
ncbi:type VII secretion system-associated protein [Streptomyces sp. NPDC046988]|uniref:type VII secretion system-associated protein n=1 Tax=Streptomyces sp. NPDC046988 TaxID=3154922 RepID=UPI0033E97930